MDIPEERSPDRYEAPYTLLFVEPAGYLRTPTWRWMQPGFRPTTGDWQLTSVYRSAMPSDLTPDQIEEFLSNNPEWTKEDESITRTYLFSDFNESLGFVVRIGIASEIADHHPDIDIRWNKVTCVLTTHDQGALTSKDLTLAAEFDGFLS
jgi:4a-hydroxytetrahydrobiopterin dehydratase